MRTKFLLMLPLALALSGCGTTSILKGGSSLTATIANPVGINQLYDIENAYGVVLAVAVNYKRLCVAKTIASSCRGVVVRMQGYKKTADAALVALRGFVNKNDQISAVSALEAAKQAVLAFQNSPDFAAITYATGSK